MEKIGMAKIGELLAHGRTFSFEFFPPRTDDGERQLEQTLRDLESLNPSFVSVTYGAGGSTRDRTHELVVSIPTFTSMFAMAHLTCAAHTRDELVGIVTRYNDAGVENILALGGDPPKDADLPAGELEYAVQLVELVQDIGPFSVGVAAHPEGHPRSPDLTRDRDHLAEKLRIADFAITQFFFRVEDYLSLVDDLSDRGVTKPVIPGIMPVTNVKQIERFAEMSGAELPVGLSRRLYGAGDDQDAVSRIGIEVATELCEKLLDNGAPGLHFFTLNRSTATREIYVSLGLAGAIGGGSGI